MRTAGEWSFLAGPSGLIFYGGKGSGVLSNDVLGVGTGGPCDMASWDRFPMLREPSYKQNDRHD